MALPEEHQLKFNIHKDAKSLMEAIEKRFGGNKETKKVQKTLLKQQYENFIGSSSESLDQIHDRLQKLISQLEILGESLSHEDINLKFLRSLPTYLKIYEAEVKSSSYTSPTTQNIAFVSSQNTDNTNESVSVVTSVFATSTKVPVSALLNVDNLNADDLEEMDLKWQMAMLTMRARRFLQRTERNLGANGTTLIGFDMSKCDGVGSYDWNFQADEEPTNYALMTFTSSSSSSSDNEVAPCSKACTKAYATLQSHYDKLTNDLMKDNALVELRKKFEKAKTERDQLKLKLENFHTSSKNLSKLLASKITDKTGLGYDNQVFNSTVFDCDKLISSDVSMPSSLVHDRYQSREGYHAVPPTYTGIFMPSKSDLVFYDAPTANEIVPTVLNVEPSTTKPNKDLPPVKPVEHPTLAKNLRKDIPKTRSHRHSWNRKACFVCKNLTHLIKDCDYHEKKMVQKPIRNHAMRGHHPHYARMSHSHPDRHVVSTAVLTRSRLVPITAARPVTTDGNPHHALKDKGVIDSGCSINMTRNISYLSNFEKINGGYVALVEIQKVATLDESNRWHKRLGHINFKTMNKLVKDLNQFYGMKGIKREFSVARTPQQNELVERKNKTLIEAARTMLADSLLPIPFWGEAVNTACYVQNRVNLMGRLMSDFWLDTLEWTYMAVDIDTLTQYMNYQPIVAGNQPNFSSGLQEHFDAGKVGEGNVQQYVLFPLWFTGSKDPQNTDADATLEVKEPESEVHVSPSSSAKTKKHDDQTKKEAKGKNLV
nr:hypothetical protein [Tanacetum cinerariifolium]